MTRPTRLYAATALLSGALLVFEVGLTRLFSVTLWYHFAFLAVSTSMFGLALGAVIVSGRAGRTADDEGRLRARIGTFSGLMGLAAQAAVLLHLAPPVDPGGGGLPRALTTYLLLLVPFTLGGMAVGLLLTRFPGLTARVYAADLLGAGLGAVIGRLVLDWVPTPTALVWAGVPAALAGRLVAPGRKRTAFAVASLIVALAAPAAGLTTLRWSKHAVHSSGTASGERIEYERWNSFSRISIEPYQGRPFGWGISPVPDPQGDEYLIQKMLTIDNAAGTVITRWDGTPGALRHLKRDVTSLAYHLRPEADALVIGVGGGRDVLSALRFAPKRVTGVEINPVILDLLTRPPYNRFSGDIGADARVRLINDEGRSRLARSNERYDVIMASLIDSWAATAAGAFALTENGLYTREAFDLFLSRLTDTGVLSMSRWYVPALPGELLRLAHLAADAAEHGGTGPAAARVLIAATKLTDDAPVGVATLLLGRTPFSAADRDVFAARCADLGFVVLYPPDLRRTTRADDTRSAALLARMLNPADRAALLAELPLDVSVPTDDRPFFFNLARPSDAWRTASRQEMTEFNVEAVQMLVGLLVAAAVLAVLLLFGPLVWREGPGVLGEVLGTKRSFVVYFAALGLGFMLVEMALLQRLSLFLGRPVYALSVSLAGLLTAAGAGSLAAGAVVGRLRSPRGFAAWGAACVAVLTAVGVAAPWVMALLEGADDAVRVSAAYLLVGVPGFAMGTAFPVGMRAVTAVVPHRATWLWAINGALSVVGSVAALVAAMEWGVSAAYAAGTACYGIAAFAAVRMATHLRTAARAEADRAG